MKSSGNKKLNNNNNTNVNQVNMNKKLADLFSGTGAFSYVFENNGFNCVFANDMVAESKSIYELNNKNKICM